MSNSLYEKFCEKFLGAYVFFWTLLGYLSASKKETDSFIVTKEDIEILEYSRETNKDNLVKYLKHHIMYTDDKFYPMYFFDDHLRIRFKYQNEVYQLCISQMECKNTDHSISIKSPKILSAVIKTHENDEGMCVTKQLVECHGPDRNFFSHMPDAVSDIPVLLKNHKGKKTELHTFDMMGNKYVYKL